MNEQINPQGAFVPAKCLNCGGEFPVNPSQECCVCQFCQQPVITGNAIRNYQTNHSNDRAGFVSAPPVPPQEPPKKKHTLLWVLGWIFCFPIPLTILMLRSNSMNKKVRYGIIAAGWIVYLILMISGQARSRQQEQTPPEEPTRIETTVPEDSEPETKPITTTKKTPETEPEPKETELPAEESSEDELSLQDMKDMIANGDYSLVTPEFKEFMDSYEAFCDNYLAFMQKYNSGEGDMMSMLNDYTTMITDMQEWTEKIDAIDEQTLSPADDAYYLLVTLRVEQKLIGAL